MNTAAITPYHQPHENASGRSHGMTGEANRCAGQAIVGTPLVYYQGTYYPDQPANARCSHAHGPEQEARDHAWADTALPTEGNDPTHSLYVYSTNTTAAWTLNVVTTIAVKDAYVC